MCMMGKCVCVWWGGVGMCVWRRGVRSVLVCVGCVVVRVDIFGT